MTANLTAIIDCNELMRQSHFSGSWQQIAFFADLINLYPLIHIRWMAEMGMDDVEDDGTVFDPIIK